MLNNKVVVVTGAAGTLGRAFVRGIIDKGGIAIISDINFEAAQQLARDFNGSAYAVFLDISCSQSIEALIACVMQQHGRIDALVNNAYPRNSNYGLKLEEVSYSDFCENVNLHLCGYFLVMQQFCSVFKLQGFGNIINMSSIYGSIAPRFELYKETSMTMPVEYAAIKAGVEHLTRYFAQYFKGSGIRVNSLSPGGILDQQPTSFLTAYDSRCASKGMLDAVDLTGALMFLLSDDARYITGHNLVVDDGFSL